MRFIDQVDIVVVAGSGGNGCISFLVRKKVFRGGPNGGDGGLGGNVWLEADINLYSLRDLYYKRTFYADSGRNGKSSNCRGKSGQDMVIEIPTGTKVYDRISNCIVGDFIYNKQKLMVAKGGQRGFGNVHFKSSINPAPRYRTLGGKGEVRKLRLELSLLADVGILGLPNAGKSTFLRSVTSAKPKVAEYPFTTLFPVLGVVHVDHFNSFTLADVPGIVKGASSGIGLGMCFLRHLERCRMLLHIVDLAPLDNSSPLENVKIVVDELKLYSDNLSNKCCWLVFNKKDLLSIIEVRKRVRYIVDMISWSNPFYVVSSFYNEGVDLLCKDVMQFITR